VNETTQPKSEPTTESVIPKINATPNHHSSNSNDSSSNHVSENHAMPRPAADKFIELFQFKRMGDLSEKLDSSPIENIQKALGLNARILAQNELFRGDKSSFDNAIQKLDAMNHFEDAKSFLCDEIIPMYDWTHEDRLKKAQEFIKLVRRRYR
jgi:hypothetical protein